MTGREESVTFSLKELKELEDDRIEREEKERADAERARLEAERRSEEERHERMRAEERRQEEERRRELEALAHREALQKAVVEQARVEVEIRARAEERERERRHEIELAKLRSTPPPSRSLAFLGATFVGAATALLVCGATYFGALRPSAERRIVELERAVVAADARGDSLAKRGEEQRKLIASLEEQLAAKPQAAPAVTPPKTPVKGPPTSVPKTPIRTTPQAPLPPDCDKDPMCFGLPR